MTVTNTLTDGLHGFRSRYRAALAAAVTLEAEELITASEPLVPVDEGVLRGSGHVAPAEETIDGVSVTCGYGGAAEAYALVQHERLDYHHRVGQAKYLEEPYLARAGGSTERIAATVKRLVGL
jgi:hypothetical protein